MKKNKRAISVLLLLTIVITAVLTSASCGGGQLPNGQYEPVDEYSKAVYSAITIKGNNFTIVFPVLGSMTYKYKYKDGTITFTDGGMGLSVACIYDEDTKILNYGGTEFTKVK